MNMKRIAILGSTGSIGVNSLEIISQFPEEFQVVADPSRHLLSLEQMEQQHIIRVLRIARDLDEAAQILGIDPATLWRKRKKYNL